MDFVKSWTIFVCATVMVSVVLSFMTPKGNLGKFYKTIISLFIFMSFLYPFSQSKIKFDIPNLEIVNTNCITDNMIEDKIKDTLTLNNVINSQVKCSSNINNDNEIYVDSIVVAVPDEYDKNEVKNIIYDSLSLNVEVVHIGD